MPKHNNAIIRPHLRKHWKPLVKTFFDQPAQKKRRLLKRREKAKQVFPRPLKNLRPVVHRCTQRYSGQTRLGRGFSLEEIRQAGLNKHFARTVGVAVDHRRINKSQELLQMNVDRLKTYLEKLVLLPKQEGKPKKGNNGRLSDTTEQVEPVQNPNKNVIALPRRKLAQKTGKVTSEMKDFNAYDQIKTERMNKKWAGKRAKRQEEATKK